VSSDISPSEYKSVVGPPDLKSGEEYWERARIELGYTERNDYDRKSLLFDGGKPYGGRETTGEYTMEVQHDCRCDELSRQIAVETGQATEVHPGIIQFKEPHIYYLGRESHVAVVGDRWKPEICREGELYVQTGLGSPFLAYREPLINLTKQPGFFALGPEQAQWPEIER
jgi:hypothetical protein